MFRFACHANHPGTDPREARARALWGHAPELAFEGMKLALGTEVQARSPA